jgi:hypothetical protein
MVGPIDFYHHNSAPYFPTFWVFLIYFLKCPSINTTQSYIPIVALTSFILRFKSHLLVKQVFLLNAALAMAILDLILYVHLAS